eukprot:scaffold2352_cov32-Phaeocystis_antarctica.AAC.2
MRRATDSTKSAVAQRTPLARPVAPCPRRALSHAPRRRRARGSARPPRAAPGGGRRRARGVAAVRRGSCLCRPAVPARSGGSALGDFERVPGRRVVPAATAPWHPRAEGAPSPAERRQP